ncbi:scarecrow-like protein 9 [Rutidosis leptorrhynchoides]|uniref:scarecrow-like protein 9 n=1 Tax=Rutidosis leptorrhynchoides TaxID=125765 RepID=UPI003A996241
MDRKIVRFGNSANGNGVPFGNQSITVLPDDKIPNNNPRFDNNYSIYNPVNQFRGIQFDSVSITQSPSPVDSASVQDDVLHEDCDLSDAILGFISQVLMEEDIEDKNCMFYESLDLKAAEKSFYDVIGKKYPPSPSPSSSPSYDERLFSVDQFLNSPNDSCSFSDHSNNNSYVNGNGDLNASYTSLSSFSSGDNVIDGSEISDENQMMMNFKKGVEEANKFLPVELGADSRVRKSRYMDEDADEDEERSIKQAAIFEDSTLRTNEIDLILLCSMGQGDAALRLMRTTLKAETSKDKLKDKEPKGSIKGKGKGRGRKPKNKKEVIDLRTLLVTCAQAVVADDRRNASELLKQIRRHASPFGDGSQRLAHCFANGLEARLAGTGSQIHRGLVCKKTSAVDYIKAYHLYIASSPFRKISNFASNRTIMDMAENATRIHIIDFGIFYGFQWPTFLQRISQRRGGPPQLRLTGIEFPQPGFRPAERIEETGARLKEYAKQFNVPFEYQAIAKGWENVNAEDLKIDKDEFLVVNCMYRSKNLLDETVGVDSARNMVLDFIKKINPNVFIHGILNGSYNAPFFLTRFKEALFHFSALFDMLEANVPRESSERMLLEGELFGREALNVIACEGWERIERPETYKQWHVRNLRAGFVSIPFARGIIKLAEEKVGLYHKDFMIDVENNWLVQGWKGRIIYAISCWKAA